MKIAFLPLSVEQKNTSAYYNSQAEGLARAFAELGEEATVYHMIPDLEEQEEVVFSNGIEIRYEKCRHIGKHVFMDYNRLKKDVDCYIVASDNYKALGLFKIWCENNRILCLPYIGVYRSNNASAIKRKVVDILCNNVKHYKKMHIVVKTEALRQELMKEGVSDVEVIPVGLNPYLLNQVYGKIDVNDIKKKWDYDKEDQILLFIGRMTPEKNPIGMISIFERIKSVNSHYKLLMIGKGELLEPVREEIRAKKLEDSVRIYEQVPNKDMWELFRMSECYVNLNTHEIFGMAILEAMYYECKVVAMHAPGPDLILTNGETGLLASNEEELIHFVVSDMMKFGKQAHERVEKEFLWKQSAHKFIECIEKQMNTRKA